MEIQFEELLQALRVRADTLETMPADALSGLTDPQFETCVEAIRPWSDGSMAWVERQALQCNAIRRKLALLNLLLDHAMREDYGYAAGASSGGEGMARALEINEPGHNPEADRIRRLIRKSIMG